MRSSVSNGKWSCGTGVDTIRANYQGIIAIFIIIQAVSCNSNRIDQSNLDPKLLFDQNEIDSYLKSFPINEYDVVNVPGLGKFYLDDNPAYVKQTLRKGKKWEPEVEETMEQYARPGTTALDVGAHIGSHTLTLSRMVGRKGMVYAFEPQKKVFRELAKNLELNGIKNVIPLRYAVGNGNEIIEMNPISRRDGASSIGKGGNKAELRKIDSFPFNNVSLIKIDVEGFEIPVIKGAAQTLKKWRPALIVEVESYGKFANIKTKKKKKHVDEFRKLIEKMNYSIYLISCSGECDVLCLPKSIK